MIEFAYAYNVSAATVWQHQVTDINGRRAMSGGIVGLIIQLIAGAAGGNIVGALAKQLDLGPIWNSVAGIVGGGIGGQILGAVMGGGAAASGGLDIGSIIGQIAAGGVGGGVLMAIIGAVKQAMGGGSR